MEWSCWFSERSYNNNSNEEACACWQENKVFARNKPFCFLLLPECWTTMDLQLYSISNLMSRITKVTKGGSRSVFCLKPVCWKRLVLSAIILRYIQHQVENHVGDDDAVLWDELAIVWKTTKTKWRKFSIEYCECRTNFFRCFCVVLVVEYNGSITPSHGEDTSSYRFNLFIQGIGYRMESDIRNNVVGSTELYIKFLKCFRRQHSHVWKYKGKGRWVIGGTLVLLFRVRVEGRREISLSNNSSKRNTTP